MSIVRITLATAALLALVACGQEGSESAARVAAAPAPPAAAATPRPEPTADAGLTLPGPFAQSTTREDFEQRFGKSNVQVSEVRETDGSVRRSLVLFPDDPSRRAYVTFHDAGKMTDVASILVSDPGSRWRGPNGVRVGMSFADLRQANGKAFHFSGFDDQGRAWVRDQWSPALDDDATLGALDVAEGDHMYFGVDLGLRDAGKGLPAGAWPKEDSVLSDDARYPQLGAIVEVTAISAYTSLDDEWE